MTHRRPRDVELPTVHMSPGAHRSACVHRSGSVRAASAASPRCAVLSDCLVLLLRARTSARSVTACSPKRAAERRGRTASTRWRVETAPTSGAHTDRTAVVSKNPRIRSLHGPRQATASKWLGLDSSYPSQWRQHHRMCYIPVHTRRRRQIHPPPCLLTVKLAHTTAPLSSLTLKREIMQSWRRRRSPSALRAHRSAGIPSRSPASCQKGSRCRRRRRADRGLQTPEATQAPASSVRRYHQLQHRPPTTSRAPHRVRAVFPQSYADPEGPNT
mmetsp:Transcript_20441/g.53205  ORF Transcript_20441/g.53205 Transcript_20441/m.53205 type:complete len:272 (+) Transcript_20441:242-1057(+)